MATNPDNIGNNAMAAAMIAAAGSVENLMQSVEGNAPKTAPVKKGIPMTSVAKSVAKSTKDAKSPIARLYGERVGKKVIVGDMTFLIEEPISQRTNEPARSFKVVKAKGDLYLGRVIFAHELDREVLNYKVNRSVKAFDERVALHAILRPLAVAASLAKAAAPKAKPAHKIAKGRQKIAAPVATPLVRMDTVLAPDSQPVSNFGIERLLTAPAGKKVGVGACSFVVEEGQHEQGPPGRRYVCVKAPEDLGLGSWVMDSDVRTRTFPVIPDKVKGNFREGKVVLHQLLRDAAINAGLVKGKYAERPAEAITDQAVCLASIRDGIEGRFLVQHPDYNEDAIVELQTEDGRHGKVLQIILVRNNQDGLKGVSAGTRMTHAYFKKGLNRSDKPLAVQTFMDWLDDAMR